MSEHTGNRVTVHLPSNLRQVCEGLEAYLVAQGSIHDDDCPEDDTCDCCWQAANAGANAAHHLLRDLLRASTPSPEMPPIEVGDWVKTENSQALGYAVLVDHHTMLIVLSKDTIIEVRKANGTVWRR